MPTYRKGDKGKYQLVVTEKAWTRLKQNLKAITRKTTPSAFDERIEQLTEVQRGWVNYFRLASIQGKLKGWIVGSETGCATAFGMTGRNPSGKERT